MMTFALTVALLVQESPDRLREAFPQLQEAWKALAKPSGATGQFTDDTIRGLGKFATALEAAGLFDAEAATDARALKRLLIHRAQDRLNPEVKHLALPGRIRIVRGWRKDGTPESQPGLVLDRFEKAVEKQGTIPVEDKERRQEVFVEQREALTELGVLYDAIPEWQRRRILTLAQALVAGQPYPVAAKATPEQEKQIRELIGQLSESEIEKRDVATRALGEFGELMVPFVREALAHADLEVRERAKELLGVGLKDPEIARPITLPEAIGTLEEVIELVEPPKVEDKEKK